MGPVVAMAAGVAVVAGAGVGVVVGDDDDVADEVAAGVAGADRDSISNT